MRQPASPASFGAADIRLRVVTGYFDPVLAAHVRRLKELAVPNTTLMVLVNTAEDSLLDVRSAPRRTAGRAAHGGLRGRAGAPPA